MTDEPKALRLATIVQTWRPGTPFLLEAREVASELLRLHAIEQDRDRLKAEREGLRTALLACARKAEALKVDCGMDPESGQAIRNGQYQNISTTAHIALGTICGTAIDAATSPGKPQTVQRQTPASSTSPDQPLGRPGG